MPNNATYDKTNITVSGDAKGFEELGKDLTDKQLQVRQEALRILMANFGGSNSAQSIYECANEWCEKFKTTSGLVKYYEAYYTTPK